MPKPFVIQAEAFQNGAGLIRARMADWDGEDITQDVIASGTYSLIDTASGEVIDGHDGVTITIADAVFNTLQTPASGKRFNFRLYLNNTDNECFPVGGVVVRCEVRLIDTLGRPIDLWANIYVVNSEIPEA